MKRVLLVVLGVVVVFVLVFGGIMAATFSGLVPVQPVTDLGGPIGVADGYVQAFIVPLGDGKAALIDCGNDPAAEKLKAKLAELKLEVKAIFLTHGHRDHVGGCQAFPGAEVYAMAAEKPMIEGEVAAKGPLPRMSKNDPAKSPKVAHALSDGEVVELGAAKVQGFLVPGHTTGSAAYLAGGVLFLGDAVTGQADGKVRNAPWIFSDDVEQCRKSIQSLATRLEVDKVEVKWLAFAHSGPMPGLAPLAAF
ncbi:MAG: MBL fold metallo-hydrolase [Myxococcaceae bacterium]